MAQRHPALDAALLALDASPLELLGAIADGLSAHLAADGCCAHLTDPASGVPIGGLALGSPPGSFEQAFEFEHRRPDAMTFAALARRRTRSGALGVETAGDLSASARFREMIEPGGARDELRASFTDAFGTWGTVVLFRDRRFSHDDLALVASVVPRASRALRAVRTHEQQRPSGDPSTSVVVLDGADRLCSADAAGRQRIARLGGGTDGALPPSFFAVAARARERAAGDPARAQVRETEGQWLTLEGAPLDDERYGAVALVIRPATSESVADIVLRAYGLSQRERQVATLARRGRPAKAIAAELALSPYTVEDHLRHVYDKTGARTREGLARLSTP
jgi:DNA-binding CsgD family transcriptional regulator